MTTAKLLGAFAITTLFIAGCQDDRALGAERNRFTPTEMPPANDHRPLDEPPTPGTSDPMATSQYPRTPTAAIDESRAATIEGAPEVINGEDLASIPELREPIWASAARVETHRASKPPNAGVEPDMCVANPSGQERQEDSETSR